MKNNKMIVIILAVLGLVAILSAVLFMNNKEEIVTYQVQFNTNGGTSVMSQTIKEGDKVTKPTDPTRDSYIFVEWQLDGVTYDFNQIVTKDLTLNAKWTKVEEGKETYVVKFNSDGGTTISNQVVEKGNKATRPNDPTKSGYIFKGWVLEDKTYDFNSIVETNIELTAKWERITYTVKFNSNGGSNVTSKTIGEGDKVTKPGNPSRTGYAFVEWQLDGKTYDFNSKVTKNIELTAKWKRITYTVKFNSNGGNNIATQTIGEGDKVTKPENPTKEEHTFVEWQLNGKAYDFNSKVTKNIELKAVWKKVNKYTVTFDSDGGSNVTSQTIVEGNKATKPTNPTKDGYTFVEWQLDGKAYDFNSIVTKNIEIVAKWERITYTVKFNSNGGSSVTSQTIVEGNKVTKPENPTKEDYTFVEWQLDGKAYDFNTKVTKNIELTAKWKNDLWDIDSTGAIIKYNGAAQSVVIPDEIDGIVPVSIKTGAFNVLGLSSITLSNSIVSLEPGAIVERSIEVVHIYITHEQFENNSWLSVLNNKYSTMQSDSSNLGTFMSARLPGNSYHVALYNKVGGYSLSYRGNCGGFPPKRYNWHIKTEDYNLSNVNIAGYTFLGWTDENGGSPKKDFVIPKGNTKDKTLYAHCDVNKWSFKLVYNEGTLDYSKVDYNKSPYCGSSSNYCKYEYTDTVEIPYNQVIREGYTFSGWATKQNGSVVYEEGQKISKVVSENNGVLTLYARWRKN